MTLQLQSTDINTRGFESLLDLVDNTANDSFELYYGLFLYNQNATEELERLEQVCASFELLLDPVENQRHLELYKRSLSDG